MIPPLPPLPRQQPAPAPVTVDAVAPQRPASSGPRPSTDRTTHSFNDIDDPFAPLVASTIHRRRQLQTSRRRRRVVVTAATPLVTIGVAAAGVALVAARNDALASPPTLAAAHTTPWCATEVSATRVVSNESGAALGTDTQAPRGATQVLDLEHQMYVARSADGVRAVIAPEAKIAPRDATRAAIAALPTGTQHCVYIVALSPNRLGVTVEEKRPDTSVVTHDLVVTTAQQPDGRTLILAISAGVDVR